VLATAQAEKESTKEAEAYAIAMEKIGFSERQQGARNQFDVQRTIGGIEQQSLQRGLSSRLALIKAGTGYGDVAGAEYNTRMLSAGSAYGYSQRQLSVNAAFV